MPELIDCFSKAGLPHLREKYQKMIGSGMSEPEAANKIAVEYHKELHDQLNAFKKSIKVQQDKYEQFDNTEKIKALNETENQTPEIPKQAAAETTDNGAVDKVSEGTTEPPSPPTEEKLVSQDEAPLSGITHEATEETRKQFNLSEPYEKTTKKDEDLRLEAEAQVKKGYNIEKLITDIEGGKQPSDVENTILKIYKAGLEKKIETDPSEENLSELKRFVKATDKIGSETGRSLRSRQGLEPRDDSLAGFFIREIETNNDAPLTEKQKETVQKEYNDISEAQKKYDEKIAALEAGNAKLKAEKEIKKQKPSVKTKKTHEDFVKERKQITEDIKEKLRKARGETSAVIIPYAKELFAIAPDVAKLTKSLVEEGILKLEELVDNIHGTLKESIPKITKKDVNDLIAGEYNEKRPPRKELAATLFDLRTQAQLINKLEKVLAGEEPKGEKQKIKRNQEIEKLRAQIKDIQGFDAEVKKEQEAAAKLKAEKSKEISKELSTAEKESTKEEKRKVAAASLEEKMMAKEAAYRTPEEKALETFKSKTKKQIEKIEADLRSGNFDAEVKKPQVTLDDEAKKLKDQLVKLKTQREVRIMKQQYENRSAYEKTRDWTIDKLNVPRTIMASMDYSAPLRQGLVAGISHPRTAVKAGVEMFKSSFSQKNFDRWMYEMREDPRFEIMQKSGLSVTDPHSPFLAAKEEAFMNNTAEKIPLIGKLIKGSERAYVMFLNKMRVDLFNRFADRFEEKGKTFENSPQLYKAVAKLINAETGRGQLGALENAAPILNTLFFSPRLIASRVNLLTNWANPLWYKNTPKEVRVMYMKDMLKFIGLGMSLLALAKYGGNAQVEDDPRSSDFGKIKSGNTRWDIWGGFQQYIRLVTQMAWGEKKSSNTGEIQQLDSKGRFGESRTDVGLRFLRGKLAPVPSMFTDWVSGRTTTGEEVTLPKELESHLTPLIYQDIKEAMKDKGVSSLFTVGVPAIFGVGVQTYEPNKPKVKAGGARATKSYKAINKKTVKK